MFKRNFFIEKLNFSHSAGVLFAISFFIFPVFSSSLFFQIFSEEKLILKQEHLQVACDGILGPNLYPKGDFGSGSTNTSQTDPNICPNYFYEYNAAPIDSFYTLCKNTGLWTDPQSMGNWKNTTDRSADPNGYMMVVNLIEDPHVFLIDSVDVCAGLSYQFSFETLNLIFPEHDFWAKKADIEILINGQVYYDTGELPQDTSWHKHEFLFSIPTGSTCVFEFRNKTIVGLGGDIAIDNIEIAACMPDLEILMPYSTPLCEYETAILIAQAPAYYNDFDLQWQAFNGSSGWQNINNQNKDTLTLDSVWLDGPMSFRYQLYYSELSIDPACQLISVAYDFDLIPRAFTLNTHSVCIWDDHFSTGGNNRFSNPPLDTLIIDTLVASNGCDSIVHLQVYNFYHDSHTQDIDLCEGDSLWVGLVAYTESGEYIDTLLTYDGCDSVVYSNINLILDEEQTLDIYLCEGDSHEAVVYFQDSTYQDTLLSSDGCPIFLETNIYVYPNVETSQIKSIQEGEAYNGIYYLQDTILVDTLLAQNGCDSMVSTFLEVRPDFYNSERILICEGDSFQNILVLQNLTILDTLVSSIESDSFLIYDVRILPQDTIINTNYSCDEIEQGIEETNYTNQFGCDSLVININVYLGDPDTTMILNYTCDPLNTLYEETLLQNERGCDSLVINEMRFAASYETINEFNFCEGALYNGSILTKDTIIYDSLFSIHGCDSIIMISIQVHPATQVSIEASDVIFCKEQGMVLTAQSNDQVIWNNGSQEKKLELSEGGWYSVQAENQFGCVAKDSIFINEPIEIIADPMVYAPSCLGLFDGKIDIFDPTGGSPPYLYSIDGFNFQSSPAFGNLSPAMYDLYIEDSNGCQYIEQVELPEKEALFLDLGEDLVINEGEASNFQFSTNAQVVDSMSWYPSQGLNCQACKKPRVSPEVSTLYTLTIMDENGCITSDEIYVEVIASFIFAPSVFSPNGDGINDFFTIFGDVEKVSKIQSLKIFDRWGAQMFSKKYFQHSQESEGWNGKRKGKYLETGIFIYEAELLLKTGEIVVKKGDFMLFR